MLKQRLIVFACTAVLAVLAFIILACGVSRAGPDGDVPFPGLCDYPGVGASGLDGLGVFHYWCDFPTEINGSHWHCFYGGAASQGTVGVSLIFNASISTPVGVLQGSCSFRCPNMTMAATPNPPGQWKVYLKPATCHSISPNPDAPVSATPYPREQAPPPQPPQLVPDHTPAVTNPEQPNPEATDNPPT